MTSRSRASSDQAPPNPNRERRLLFLDDDPARARVFLESNPNAVWVETVADCVKRLEENWDEVHLDHDLGGERFVEIDREDCGMEVVRWLCLGHHPHLLGTRFYIHSHNESAASMMLSQMRVSGFKVSFRPFGQPNVSRPFAAPEIDFRPPPRGFLAWLLAVLRGTGTEEPRSPRQGT